MAQPRRRLHRMEPGRFRTDDRLRRLPSCNAVERSRARIRGVESTEPSIGERGTTCRFPYTARELHEWADTVDADFVAGMDVACEEASELIEMGYDDYGYLNPGRYEERLMESIDNQVRQRDHFEQHDYDHKLMPVVQGNTLDDYDQFIQWMVEEDLDKYEKIGLGTVCKRSDTDEIFDVIQLVRDYFPKSDCTCSAQHPSVEGDAVPRVVRVV